MKQNNGCPAKIQWLVHCVDPANFAALQKSRILCSASSLMNESEKQRYEKHKRNACLPLDNGVILRDQEPLTEKIPFSNGKTFPEYVKHINEHVFFWPEKPLEGFRNKYRLHRVLRCHLGDLEKANPGCEILFCRWNAGAARCPQRKYCQSGTAFEPIASRTNEPVVEIVVRDKVKLPPETEYKNEQGEWCAFFQNESFVRMAMRFCPWRRFNRQKDDNREK